MDDRDDMPARQGRSARTNPASRFEPLHVTNDPAALDEQERRQVDTEFFSDSTRSILAKNDSPDVPFTYSVNPYRGCEHGCIYCLAGDTPILMADGKAKALRDVRVGDEIYGTERHDCYRRYVKTKVLAHWSTRKRACRITLADGTALVASADHRFLTERGWKFVIGPQQGRCRRPHLTLDSKLMGVGAFADNAIVRTGSIEGRAIKSDAALGVTVVEELGTECEMFDVTTGTGDFIASGVVSHNCYARPTHEYLGFSAGLDFETKIMVKEEAPELLSKAFQKKSWEPQVVSVSGNTDPYQPVERKLELTRRCLEVFLRHRNPVSIITKNELVTRDLDLLRELGAMNLVSVTLSITSLRDDVIGAMEPRTSRPARRLKAVEALAEAGVPVGVMVGPVIPGLTDEEMPGILAAAARRGAARASYTLCRLPEPVDELFIDWLERHFPNRKSKVLGRLRSMRGGELSDDRFGRRMHGTGRWAQTLQQLFDLQCRKLNLNMSSVAFSTEHFRPLRGGQMDLF